MEDLVEKTIDIHTHIWLDEFRDGIKNDAVRSAKWPSVVARDNSIEDLVDTYRLMFPGKHVTPMVRTGCRRSYVLPTFHRFIMSYVGVEKQGNDLGLELGHDRYNIAKAVMEGVVYDINWILNAFKIRGERIDRLKVLGGATRSSLWMNIIADVTGIPVFIPESGNTACKFTLNCMNCTRKDFNFSGAAMSERLI